MEKAKTRQKSHKDGWLRIFSAEFFADSAWNMLPGVENAEGEVASVRQGNSPGLDWMWVPGALCGWSWVNDADEE